MIGADSNVLLRFLLKDEAKQTERVRHFLEQARASNETVLISSVVLCETVWVLKRGHGKSKAQLVEALSYLLQAEPFLVEAEDLVLAALQAYQSGPGDFADYLIGLIHQARGCRHTITFDRALHKVSGFSSL